MMERWTSRRPVRRLPISTRELFVWVYVVALSVVAAIALGARHPRRDAARRAAPALVGRRARVRGRGALRRPRALPPLRALLHARRRAVRLRPRVRHRRRLRARRDRRHLIVLGLIRRLELVKLLFNLAQLALAATLAAGDPERGRRQRRRAPARDVDRPVRRDAGQRRAHDPAARRRDGDRRGHVRQPMLVQMFATDALVTLINASIAIAAALVVATDPRAVPVLLVPALTVFAVYRAYISERQRHERLEFLYDANRTLQPLARGRRGAGSAARPLAGGLQRRRRRGPAVHRRRRAAAHHARPRRPPHDDGARRPRDRRRARRPRRRRAPRRQPHPALRLPAPARAHAGARHPPRDDRDAPGRGAHDRHDHARQPRRPRALLRRRRPAPAGGAGQQRGRRAPVRPARAGRQQAAVAAGPAPPPGLPRPAHRPPEPHAVHGARARGARRRRRRRRPVRGRRRLQDDQRLARPPHRRRAAGVRRGAHARLRAPGGHDRPPRRRRVRRDDPGRRRPAAATAAPSRAAS